MAGPAFQVRGAEEFAKVAKDCRAAGRKDLNKELRIALNRAVKPMKAAAKEGAKNSLPSSGGLAARVAGARISARPYGGRNPAIKLVGREGKKSVNLAGLDYGRLRHPLFGNREKWFSQSVPSGWWSKSLEGTAPKARDEIVKAIDNVVKELENG
jgi:hypothetical protein